MVSCTYYIILLYYYMMDETDEISIGRKFGMNNLYLTVNIYNALLQIGFYDDELYDVLDSNGNHTEEAIYARYLRTADFVLQIYGNNNLDKLLSNLKKKHDGVGTITQSMYKKTLAVFCAPVFFFDQYDVEYTQIELNAFIKLWAHIGKTLGIDDEHNICIGDAELVRTNVLDTIKQSFVKYQSGSNFGTQLNKIHQNYVKKVRLPFLIVAPSMLYTKNNTLLVLSKIKLINQILEYTYSQTNKSNILISILVVLILILVSVMLYVYFH